MKVQLNVAPDLSQLLALYRSVGWLTHKDSEDTVQEILNHTDEFVCIYIGDTLAAFGRMLTDYRMSAFLDDIVVHPGFRQMGLGSVMVNALLARVPNVKKVKLTTRNAAEFYKKLGFTKPSTVPMELVQES